MIHGENVEITKHARIRMFERGATEEEVRRTLLQGIVAPAKRGKQQVRHSFPFNAVSPINSVVYPFKTVECVFVEEQDRIVVITVKVYYGSE